MRDGDQITMHTFSASILILVIGNIFFVVNGCDPLISDKLNIICTSPDYETLQCNETLLDSTVAHFKCKGSKTETSQKLTCLNGTWDGVLSDQNCPTFSGECGPLVSPKVNVICIGPGSDFNILPCTEKLPNRAIAHLQCKAAGSQITAEYKTLRCVNGEWDKPLTENLCEPVCGKALSVDNVVPFIVHGSQVQYGNYPWHVGIYKRNVVVHSEWDFQCGGSLVSAKVVLSAAHCFKYEISGQRFLYSQNFTAMRVGVGKIYIKLNDSRDAPHEQDFAIKDVIIPREWEGSLDLFKYDISVVLLNGRVAFSEFAHPICLDLGNNFENQQLVAGNNGMVPGWGITEKGESSEELLVAEIPFVDIETCREESSTRLFKYVNLKTDKICGGNKITRQTVCRGDSGGGYVFKDPKTETYYLRGIVSLGVDGCKGNDYALFTKVSEYSPLISKYILN